MKWLQAGVALVDAYGNRLVEREAELATFDQALGQAREGDGTVMLVEGPSGIGKTGLLRAIREAGRRQGCRVLSARCAELEQEFAFGVVRQLFEPMVASLATEDRRALFAGAASLSAGVFSAADRAPGPTETHTASEILLATLNGLYWLTSNLAEQGPLVLLVDDAQWSDTPSLRFLDFLARRIEELPVVMAMSRGHGQRPRGTDLLLQIESTPGAQVLHLAPLDDAGMSTLVAADCGDEPEQGFLAACRAATGGNPFLLRELLNELRRQRVAPTDDQAGLVRELGLRSVAQWVQLRLGGLPEPADALARAVAVLGDGCDLAMAAQLAGVPSIDAGHAADALASASILEPGSPLRFRHTIMRTSVYCELPHAERRAGHARAAGLQANRGASPEQVCAHLLRTDPRADPGAVVTLRQAAARAMANGAFDAATNYLRRALAEPPGIELRSRVLTEFCTAVAQEARPDSFQELREQLQRVDDVRERAEIALELAQGIGSVADTASAIDVLEQALEDLGDAQSDVGLRLASDLISVARLHPETRVRALQRLRQLQPLATPQHPAGSVLLANLALDMVERGEPAIVAVDLAHQALSSGSLLGEHRWVYAYAVNVLLWADRTVDAGRAWTAAFDQASRSGSATMAHLAAVWRSHLGFRCGDLVGAEVDARIGLNISRQHGWSFSGSYALAFLVDVLIERGDLESASNLVAETPPPRPLHYLLDSLGRLRCAQGLPEEGLGYFLECGTQLEAQGGGGNPAVIAWRTNAAMALAKLGRTREARELADTEVALAKVFGAPRAIGIALRARALTDQGEARMALLDEAIEILEDSPARLEHARTLADRAAVSRDTGHRSDAEDELRRAMDLAHRCRALSLRGRIHDELLRSGLRPRRFTTTGVEALTASERRVADLAATGMANRECAQALYVSLKTVETHLGSVFRKLGISARSQLAEQMAGVRPAGS